MSCSPTYDLTPLAPPWRDGGGRRPKSSGETMSPSGGSLCPIFLVQRKPASAATRGAVQAMVEVRRKNRHWAERGYPCPIQKAASLNQGPLCSVHGEGGRDTTFNSLPDKIRRRNDKFDSIIN